MRRQIRVSTLADLRQIDSIRFDRAAAITSLRRSNRAATTTWVSFFVAPRTVGSCKRRGPTAPMVGRGRARPSPSRVPHHPPGRHTIPAVVFCCLTGLFAARTQIGVGISVSIGLVSGPAPGGVLRQMGIDEIPIHVASVGYISGPRGMDWPRAAGSEYKNGQPPRERCSSARSLSLPTWAQHGERKIMKTSHDASPPALGLCLSGIAHNSTRLEP